MSSGVCLAAAMRVTERAPNLFTGTADCRVQRVSEQAVATCIASKYFCSGCLYYLQTSATPAVRYTFQKTCIPVTKRDLSDVPLASRLLGAILAWNKAVLDTHCMPPSEAGNKH